MQQIVCNSFICSFSFINLPQTEYTILQDTHASDSYTMWHYGKILNYFTSMLHDNKYTDNPTHDWLTIYLYYILQDLHKQWYFIRFPCVSVYSVAVFKKPMGESHTLQSYRMTKQKKLTLLLSNYEMCWFLILNMVNLAEL